MLSGCPQCGGNKFQFHPKGWSEDGDDSIATDSNASAASDTSTPDNAPSPRDLTESDPSRTERSSVAQTVGRATTKVRDFVASDPKKPPKPDAEWPDDWESSVSSSDDASSSSRSPPSDSPAGSNPTASSAEQGVNDNIEEDDDDIIDADARRESAEEPDIPKENAAQASARTDVVSPDELDQTASEEPDESTAIEGRIDTDSYASTADSSTVPDSPSNGEVVSEPTGEEPDLAELRAQLNDQFESIKILEPGQYELNLMELYDREEYIIALQENGRYVIQVPEQWIGDDLDDR